MSGNKQSEDDTIESKIGYAQSLYQFIMKNIILTVVVLIVAVFLVWFVPVWWDGLTRTRASQMCRLNQSALGWEIDNTVVNYYPSKENGGFIDFEFEDGNKLPMMAWVFKDQLDTIERGDKLVKLKGDLFLRIIGRDKNISFSLDHGCPQ